MEFKKPIPYILFAFAFFVIMYTVVKAGPSTQDDNIVPSVISVIRACHDAQIDVDLDALYPQGYRIIRMECTPRIRIRDCGVQNTIAIGPVSDYYLTTLVLDRIYGAGNYIPIRVACTAIDGSYQVIPEIPILPPTTTGGTNDNPSATMIR